MTSKHTAPVFKNYYWKTTGFKSFFVPLARSKFLKMSFPQGIDVRRR
jgi:hypothetical protein